MSCCSHIGVFFFFIIGTWFGNTAWRDTYIAFLPQLFSQLMQLFKSHAYVVVGVFTFRFGRSIKFFLNAFQCFSKAFSLCVWEKDVLASFHCSDWGRLVAARGDISKYKLSQMCEVSTPAKLISCTRDPLHVVYKSSSKPWHLSLFDAGEYPTPTFFCSWLNINKLINPS